MYIHHVSFSQRGAACGSKGGRYPFVIWSLKVVRCKPRGGSGAAPKCKPAIFCMAETRLLMAETQHHSKELTKKSSWIPNGVFLQFSRKKTPGFCNFQHDQSFGVKVTLLDDKPWKTLEGPHHCFTWRILFTSLDQIWSYYHQPGLFEKDYHTRVPERGAFYWQFFCRTISLILVIAEDDPILATNQPCQTPSENRAAVWFPCLPCLRCRPCWHRCPENIARCWRGRTAPLAWPRSSRPGKFREEFGASREEEVKREDPFTVFPLNKCQITVIQWSPLKQCHPSSPWSIHKLFANQPWKSDSHPQTLLNKSWSLEVKTHWFEATFYFFLFLWLLKKKDLFKNPFRFPWEKKHQKQQQHFIGCFFALLFFSPLAKIKIKNAHVNSYHLSKNSKSLQVWWGRNWATKKIILISMKSAFFLNKDSLNGV